MSEKFTEEEAKLSETLFDYFAVGTMDIRYLDIARYIIMIDRGDRDKQLAEKDAETKRLGKIIHKQLEDIDFLNNGISSLNAEIVRLKVEAKQ